MQYEDQKDIIHFLNVSSRREDKVIQGIQLSKGCFLARIRLAENNFQSIGRPVTMGIDIFGDCRRKDKLARGFLYQPSDIF